MWKLIGIYKEKDYEHWAMDIEYLKAYLTMVLKSGGSGYIFKA
ncbi:MAG: hypothetical protein Q9M40_07250 [Sulfurimonas sp.]|nr:hypothetical protein [Sulfurimonas sp.]